MGILAYLGILVIIPLIVAKNDPFVKYHVKQGLVLLVLEVIGSFVFWIPILGWLLWLFTLVLVVIGILNVTKGKQQPLPVLGKYADHFHF
ncbi:MAG: hypothetical protein KW788_03310 [Candidatus Doudnabacteria bacterium]|nr:hypothetical protein [Candidatus Doudnabacteria bacterium]